MEAASPCAVGNHPTAPLVDGAVEQLVDEVLANAPEPLRWTCDRDGIIGGLWSCGACSVPTLRSLLELDYAEVKGAIGASAKAAFVAMLKETVLTWDGLCGAYSATIITCAAA